MFHLDYKYQLVEIIDKQGNFVLLKNHIPRDANDVYTIGVENLNGCPVIPENHSWMNHFKVDSLMAFLLDVSVYDKATKDWMSDNE